MLGLGAFCSNFCDKVNFCDRINTNKISIDIYKTLIYTFSKEVEELKKQFSYRATLETIATIKRLMQEYRVNGNDILDLGVYLVERDLQQGKTIYDLQNEMYRHE